MSVQCLLIAFRSDRHVITCVALHALRNLSFDAIVNHTNVISTKTMAGYIFMKTVMDEDRREDEEKLLANMLLDWIASCVFSKDCSVIYGVVEEAHQGGDQLAVISVLAMAGNDIRLWRSDDESNFNGEAREQPICYGRWKSGRLNNDYYAGDMK